jgi:hypothetical protein
MCERSGWVIRVWEQSRHLSSMCRLVRSISVNGFVGVRAG